MKKIIEFYKTYDNYCQVEEFLDSLDDKTGAKIIAVLKWIEDQDIIPAKFFKKLKSTNIYEVRIKYGSNIYRILCFFYKNSIIVLTNGFLKKSQKTPKNEIEKAEKYMQDYLRRKP